MLAGFSRFLAIERESYSCRAIFRTAPAVARIVSGILLSDETSRTINVDDATFQGLSGRWHKQLCLVPKTHFQNLVLGQESKYVALGALLDQRDDVTLADDAIEAFWQRQQRAIERSRNCLSAAMASERLALAASYPQMLVMRDFRRRFGFHL